MKETRSAFIERHDGGIIIVRTRDGFTQTLDDAKENVAASLALADGARLPLLVNITTSPPLESRVRHFYAGGALADNFVALALVVEASPLGRMMGNVFFGMMEAVRRSHEAAGIPTRLFDDEVSAISWLARPRA